MFNLLVSIVPAVIMSSSKAQYTNLKKKKGEHKNNLYINNLEQIYFIIIKSYWIKNVLLYYKMYILCKYKLNINMPTSLHKNLSKNQNLSIVLCILLYGVYLTILKCNCFHFFGSLIDVSNNS